MQRKSKYSKQQKQQIIEDCLNRKEKEGFSIAAYARQNNISRQTLYTWIENFKKNKPQNLVKLTIRQNENINHTNDKIINIKINTSFCSIDVPSTVKEETLQTILIALKGVN